MFKRLNRFFIAFFNRLFQSDRYFVAAAEGPLKIGDAVVQVVSETFGPAPVKGEGEQIVFDEFKVKRAELGYVRKLGRVCKIHSVDPAIVTIDTRAARSKQKPRQSLSDGL